MGMRIEVNILCFLCRSTPFVLFLINFKDAKTPLKTVIMVIVSLLYYSGIFVWRYGGKLVQPTASRTTKTHKLVLARPRRTKPCESRKSNSIIQESCHARKKHSPSLSVTGTEIDGYEINKLCVSTEEIAKVSKGIVTFEREYDGRKFTVKRLDKALRNAALQEVKNLIKSDHHPNIVRFFWKEENEDYVDLVLEHCICNLNDLISQHADPCNSEATGAPWKTIIQKINLWKSNGYPSTLLLKLMRGIVSGLYHLHGLNIIHQGIKPQNVMIAKGKRFCAKLSDIGNNKCLPSDMPSLSGSGPGSGSSILREDQTQAEDMFSLGRVFLFCLTRGVHPFDDKLACNIHIEKKRMEDYLKDHRPEAVDLLCCLMNSDPEFRPTALQVLDHPLFWDSETRLSFLCDASDRIESEVKNPPSNILKGIESKAQLIFGKGWNTKIDEVFLNEIGIRRKYNYTSVQDLLRAVRNKYSHYNDLPHAIKELLGRVRGGLDDYFSIRFPCLLMFVYNVLFEYCSSEESFEKYFRSDLVPRAQVTAV